MRTPRPRIVFHTGLIAGSTVLILALITAPSAQTGGSGSQTVIPLIDSTAIMTVSPYDSIAFSDRPPVKAPFHGEPNRPARVRQGGDDFTTATVVMSLPFSDFGSTAGYADDYYESCIGATGAPDVVYAYTPSVNVVADIMLCGSSYDTYLHIYADYYTPGAPQACNDDYCWLSSGIAGFTMYAGTTYYLVIDGYGGGYGYYQLEISAITPCPVTCPPGAVMEGESCLVGAPDYFNGGCNIYPYGYSPITATDTICGTSYSSVSRRDTDWYRKTFTGDTILTWKVVASFPVFTAILDLSAGCWPSTVYAANGGPCDTVTISVNLTAGTYVFYVSPSVYSNAYTCATGPWPYVTWLECQTPPPAPPNNNCGSATPIGDVVNLPFTTQSATHDGSYSCTGSRANVWFCYTAPITGTLMITACAETYPTRVAVYSGCGCPTPYPLVCTYNPCSPTRRIALGVTAGQSYLIEVASANVTTGPGLLTARTIPPPPNNYCASVVPQTLPATFVGDNTLAGRECGLLSWNHVWHAFTITECTDVTLDYCGTSPSFDNVSLVLVAGCTCDSTIAATEYAWSPCYDGNRIIRWQSLNPGTYYYPVLSDPYNGSEGPYVIQATGTPTRCRPCGATAGCDEHIARVTLGTIDVSSGCSGYADYTGSPAEFWRRLAYPLTVTTGHPYYGDRCGVWVDWNQDADFFDLGETITMTSSPGAEFFTGEVVPPAGAATDTVILRARILWNASPQPCGSTPYGEVEDYALILKPFTCGDWNGDGLVNQADLQAIANYYFNNGPCAVPCEASDATCDNTSNLADIVQLVKYVFGSGPPPCCGP